MPASTNSNSPSKGGVMEGKMGTTKFDVLNRYTGQVQFTAEIDCAADAPPIIKLGLAVKWALKAGANLARANLANVNLAEAYLANVNLAGAYLADVNLAHANLGRANLANVNLVGANLANANLAHANLAGANLARADLANANLAGADLVGAKIRDRLTLTRRPMFIGPIGLENGTLIAWPTNDGLRLKRGCFFGTVDEFARQSDKTHGTGSPVWTTYRAALALIAAWDKQHSEAAKAAA